MKKLLLLLLVIGISPAWADDSEYSFPSQLEMEMKYKEVCYEYINFVENSLLWKMSRERIERLEKAFSYKTTVYNLKNGNEIGEFKTGLKLDNLHPLLFSSFEGKWWELGLILQQNEKYKGCEVLAQFRLNF